MKVLCIVLGSILLLLLLLALIPLAVRVVYGQDGVVADAKVWLLRFRLTPRKAKKKKWKKKEQAPPQEEAPEEEAEEKKEKKGGSLDMLRAALPLVEPALSGVKKRLVIRRLDLHVTWAAQDPADAALGYGYANAALGMLWAVVDQNFKVKKSTLGCSVDYELAAPAVFADADISLRLGQAVTLGLPLLIRFLRASSRIKKEKAQKTRKEA